MNDPQTVNVPVARRQAICQDLDRLEKLKVLVGAEARLITYCRYLLAAIDRRFERKNHEGEKSND